MKIYLAPMEGITGYTYRNAYRLFYKDADRYFTPFISTHKKFGGKVLNEISPDNNKEMNLVPQLMAGNAQEVLGLQDLLLPYGYEQVNLNLGCPSGTVVSKGRGSGLLKDLYALEQMLDEIFAQDKGSVSVKTRIGFESTEEWPQIAKLLGDYPFSEVIIHGRVRSEFYNGHAHIEAFDIAREFIDAPIIYNGDIFSVEGAAEIVDRYPFLDGIMVGRGVLQNPALIEQLIAYFNKASIPENDNERVYGFVSELFDRYLELFNSEINTLYHMKEIWGFMGPVYPNHDKDLKTIRKTKSISEYKCAVKKILNV